MMLLSGMFWFQDPHQFCTSPQRDPKLGLQEAHTWGNRALSPVDGWGDCIVPVLDHVHFQAQNETLGGCVELEEHGVTLPSLHQYYFDIVNACYEELHVSDDGHGARADLFVCKSDLWYCDL